MNELIKEIADDLENILWRLETEVDIDPYEIMYATEYLHSALEEINALIPDDEDLIEDELEEL